MPDTGRVVEDSDLASIIASEIRNSQSYDQSELAQKRAVTLEYLRGIMNDIPPRPNGSAQTSRDISDTVSWILPGIVRVFMASDQMVMYDQVKDENPEWAEQATAYMNYTFMANDGYMIVYNATYDSLIMGNGVVRCDWQDEDTKKETLRGQTLQDIAMLVGDGKVRILTASPSGETAPLDMPDELGNNVVKDMPTYDLKIERVISEGKVCDETCKPENLFINTGATVLDEARFVGYLHDNYTRSDLMEMADDYGWDKSEIDDLPVGPNMLRNQVGLARNYDLVQNFSSPIKSGDQIDLYENYLRADVDGDGVAELLRVWYAGNIGGGKVLSWQVWEDEIPFTDIPCYPIPHRWDAESVADRTKDIQRVKTVLLRALLDSTYQSVMPMREVDLGSVLNVDILTNPRFGGIIWKKAGSPDIRPHEIPYTGDKSLAAMQAMDELITKRTGVSRSTMALDPEALQNQTATANQNLRDAGYSQIELIARNQAERGWKTFFRKRLKLAIKYHEIASIPAPKGEAAPDQVGAQPSAPKFQEVQPGLWDENMAVNINVGLGTGSRDRDMAMLNVMLNGQVAMADRLGSVNPMKAIEFIPKIRNTAVKIAESAGIKNPDDYYPDFTDADVAKTQQMVTDRAQQGDPKLALEQQQSQSKMAIEQQAAASDQQIAQIKAQAETTKSALELQIQNLKLQNEQISQRDDLQIEQLKAQLQAATSGAQIDAQVKMKALELLVSTVNTRIAASKDTEGGPQPAIGPIEELLQNIVSGNGGLGGSSMSGSQATNDELSGALNNIASALQQMNAPKQVVRDPVSGQVTGVQPVAVN